MNLLIATKNRGKQKELGRLLEGFGVSVSSLADFSDAPDVVEDQPTFAGNARKKARELAAHCDLLSLADDSGLEVDALDGAPGVWSARYAGPHASDEDNNRKLLSALQSIPAAERSARFVCVLALATSSGEVVFETRGLLNGRIAEEPRGAEGFGYDPLFIPEGERSTLAELGASFKNAHSHRANAMRELKRYFDETPEVPDPQTKPDDGALNVRRR